MVENIQRAADVDFQRRRHMMCFPLILLHQGVIQVFQDGHVLRARIVEIGLIHLPYRTVDHRLLDGFQAIPATDDQLTQRQDEIAFKRQRVFIVGVVEVDVHGIDVVTRWDSSAASDPP